MTWVLLFSHTGTALLSFCWYGLFWFSIKVRLSAAWDPAPNERCLQRWFLCCLQEVFLGIYLSVHVLQPMYYYAAKADCELSTDQTAYYLYNLDLYCDVVPPAYMLRFTKRFTCMVLLHAALPASKIWALSCARSSQLLHLHLFISSHSCGSSIIRV